VLHCLHRSCRPQASVRTSMATPRRGRRARSTGDCIRIHSEEHETLVGRRTWVRRSAANERLNQFGEEHARARARKRARNDECRVARTLWCDGCGGEEPILRDHRGTGRSAASSRRTRRPHPSRTARRSQGGQEDRRQEGRRGQSRRSARRPGTGRGGSNPDPRASPPGRGRCTGTASGRDGPSSGTAHCGHRAGHGCSRSGRAACACGSSSGSTCCSRCADAHPYTIPGRATQDRQHPSEPR
jgi:hypothetical protein